MQGNSLAIPGAIVVAGLLIAGAVLFVNTDRQTASVSDADLLNEEDLVIDPVTAEDHVLGNPNAPIIIVEYSDTECPFCKQFHTTMHRLMDEYGKEGKLAWVYRHFPIPQLHPKAPREAEALECAAELGGNEKFWAYTDRIYEITPANNGLEDAQLPEIATYVGLNREVFMTCLDSGRHAGAVQDDYESALASGGTGTPHSIILVEGEFKQLVPGAQPYANMKAAIETTLRDLEPGEGNTQAVPAL